MYLDLDSSLAAAVQSKIVLFLPAEVRLDLGFLLGMSCGCNVLQGAHDDDDDGDCSSENLLICQQQQL